MTRPIDAKTQAGAGKPSSGNSATTAQDRARTARGVRAARVVLSTMWGHAAGKFSLIVLGLWLASSAVSLVEKERRPPPWAWDKRSLSSARRP